MRAHISRSVRRAWCAWAGLPGERANSSSLANKTSRADNTLCADTQHFSYQTHFSLSTARRRGR